MRVEGLPDAQPHGDRRGRRRGVDQAQRQPRRPHLRHGQRGRLARRSGRGRVLRQRGAQRDDPAGALGLSVEPGTRRIGRRSPLRGDEDRADLVRGGQDRLPHAPLALPDDAEVRQHRPLRRAFRHQTADRRRRTLPGVRGDRAADRLDEGDPGQVGHHLHRRGREGLPLHDQRVDQDGRRDGNGLSGRGRAEGHGVHPVSSDGVAGHGHPDHRSLPRRRRHPRQQGRPPLSAGLRTGRSPRRERPQAPAEARDGAGSAGQAQPVLHQGEAGGAHRRDQGRARRAPRPPPPRRGQDRQADPVRAGVGAQLRGDRSGASADPGTAGRALRDGRASTSTATRRPTCRGFTPRASARACRSMGRTGSGRTR